MRREHREKQEHLPKLCALSVLCGEFFYFEKALAIKTPPVQLMQVAFVYFQGGHIPLLKTVGEKREEPSRFQDGSCLREGGGVTEASRCLQRPAASGLWGELG